MAVYDIEPQSGTRIPFIPKDESSSTLLDEMKLAGDTAELLVDMGAPLEADETTSSKTADLLKEAVEKRKPKHLSNINTAYAAAAFLKTYGQQLAFDVAAARSAVTHKLMELANCGDPKYELRALELLGKHSDIGLFTERSEITINYKTPEALEEAIKERVKRLLNAEIIDITPVRESLDEELGIAEVPEEAEKLSDELGET